MGQGTKGHSFSKEDTQMANRYMKMCLTSLTISKTQTKTAMTCHFTPIRMTVSSKDQGYQMLARMWKKGDPCVLLMGM